MLHILDLVIIVTFLLITITIGIVAGGRQRGAAEYFTANGHMRSFFQSILVGLSLAAALFSGISLLMYPSVVFSSGITVLLGLICFPLTWLVLRYWFLPRFLNNQVKKPYDIIENKLGPNIRTLAAVMYLLLRVGWMATLIYAPTLAILAATGLGQNWFLPIVLIIGVSVTVYTCLGGIKGIIFADALQFMVIIVGILFMVIFILVKLPASFGQILTELYQRQAFYVDFHFDPSKLLTFWSVIIGITVANTANYMVDQMALQRYLASGNAKTANRSYLVNMFGSLSVLVLLGVVGLSLMAWYHFMPDANLPVKPDKVFPYFVATQLPTGFAGLILAAILAATITSVSGGINAMAATITLDLRVRLLQVDDPKKQLRFAKICSLCVGAVSTLTALFVQQLGTIFEITQTFLGLFCGPLMACMIFSVIRMRVNRKAVAAGLIGGTVMGGLVKWVGWAALWMAPTSFVFAIVVILLGTLILGIPKGDFGAEINVSPVSKVIQETGTDLL